jgi:uncharacterized protein YbaP (TraB family)
MRLIFAALGILFILAGAAEARCAGKNLFAELAASEPATAAELVDRARAMPNSEGRFWRVEKAGVAPSYLFGTFHVADAVAGVPPEVWEALDSARVAVFEVTLDAESALEKRMASDPSFILDPQAPPFSERMTAADLALVQAAFKARGVAPQIAERLQPWMQISLVTFPPCQIREVAEGAQMLDVVLARRAVERGIPEIGLEEAIAALEGLSRMPREDQTKLLISAGRAAAFEEDLYHTNLVLYETGRIALIEVFGDWIAERHMPDLKLAQVNDRLMEDLLDGRNSAWLPRLLPVVAEGDAFIAVGALHLVGDSGLIAALEREGYTATRLDAGRK